MQQGRAVLDWLVGYKKAWLRPDIVAGLVTAAVIIPQAMAYASIAGLPLEVGLYTSIVPMVIYAALGSSRVLSVSTTSTISILVAASLGEALPGADAAALLKATVTLGILVGGVLVVASLLRLGFIADFISEPVLIGFKSGIGLVILLGQVPKLMGFHIEKSDFLRNLLHTIQGIPGSSMTTLIVGALTIVGLIGIRAFMPRVPGPLVMIAAGIAALGLLGLKSHGVAPVGDIPRGLPSLDLPDLSLMAKLWPGAMGIALMSFTETMAVGRAFARSEEPRIKPNRELLATGLANAGGAVLGAMPSGGGMSQTAVNRLAGAHTQLSELVTAGAALLTALLLAPLISLMPQPTLAAVVVVSTVGLIKPKEFRAILSIRRTEFVWSLAALLGVVLLGTLPGIVVAIVVSLVALAHQAADPPVHVLGRKPGTNVFRPRTKEHPEDETFPGLLMLRPEGRIFFANAARIGEKMRAAVAEANPKVVAIDLRSVFDLEYTALKMLIEGEERMREMGVSLWLVGLNPGVLEMVQRSPLGPLLGRERMHFNLETAVAKYVASQQAS